MYYCLRRVSVVGVVHDDNIVLFVSFASAVSPNNYLNGR